jgi:hypothetical protein
MASLPVFVGIARYHGDPGHFEIVLINYSTGVEAHFEGKTHLTVEQIDAACPGCVMVPAEPLTVEPAPTRWAYDQVCALNNRREEEIDLYRAALEAITRHEDVYRGFGSVTDEPVHNAVEMARIAKTALEAGNLLIIKHREKRKTQ